MKTQNEIKVVCAWCSLFGREHERFISGNPFGTKVSHGLCPECSEEMKKQVDSERLKNVNTK